MTCGRGRAGRQAAEPLPAAEAPAVLVLEVVLDVALAAEEPASALSPDDEGLLADELDRESVA